MVQFQQRCVFCGKHAKLTKEHFFGQWLKPHLRGYSNETEHYTRYQGLDRKSSLSPGRLSKRRPPHSSNLRLACQQCNNGWMSRLQEAAKPTLVKMIVGDWSQLGASEGLAVAGWATMACMCMEFADPKTLATPPSERSEVSTTSRPPKNWRVYAGLCDGSRELGAFWHRGSYLSIKPPEAGFICNVQSTVFYFGRTFFLLISSSSELLTAPAPEFANRIGIRQLWPPPAEFGRKPLVFTHAGVIRTVTAFWEPFGPINVPNWAQADVMPSIVYRPRRG